jgi:hypothetical protein
LDKNTSLRDQRLRSLSPLLRLFEPPADPQPSSLLRDPLRQRR